LPFILNGATGEPTPVDKSTIPARLKPLYADVAAKAAELRRQGMTHMQVVQELNRLGYRTRRGKPWRYAQQIIKLLRSFGGQG
jgi:hypothetical protein